MSTHIWGDRDFDWRSLDDAIQYIATRCRRYGMRVHAKEKWGNADIYVDFWDGTFFTLFYENSRRFIKWPHWLRDIDFKLQDFFILIRFVALVNYFQYILYRRIYDEALSKWPHIKEEIVGGIAHWEILEQVMIKHGLDCPFKSEQCKRNEHEFLQNNCKHCYISRDAATTQTLLRENKNDSSP